VDSSSFPPTRPAQDASRFGLGPAGHRATSILLHAFAAGSSLATILVQKAGGVAAGLDEIPSGRGSKMPPPRTKAWTLTGSREGRVDDRTHECEVALFLAKSQEAISRRPDFVEAHANLGVLLFQDGRVQQSIAELQRALALDPNHEKARRNLEIALRAGSAESSTGQPK
jgi:tetratricopeptide (TPR) repeat protein